MLLVSVSLWWIFTSLWSVSRSRFPLCLTFLACCCLIHLHRVKSFTESSSRFHTILVNSFHLHLGNFQHYQLLISFLHAHSQWWTLHLIIHILKCPVILSAEHREIIHLYDSLHKNYIIYTKWLLSNIKIRICSCTVHDLHLTFSLKLSWVKSSEQNFSWKSYLILAQFLMVFSLD